MRSKRDYTTHKIKREIMLSNEITKRKWRSCQRKREIMKSRK